MTKLVTSESASCVINDPVNVQGVAERKPTKMFVVCGFEFNLKHSSGKSMDGMFCKLAEMAASLGVNGAR